MPRVDFTIEDLKKVFATKADLERFATKDDLQSAVRDSANEVLAALESVKDMLQGDTLAEGRRIDRIDRRSLKTQRLLAQHLSDSMAHTGGAI